MIKTKDPFERLAARESKLLGRFGGVDTRQGMVRLMHRWLLTLAVGWAAALAAHWLLLGDPRWLVVLHTVLFVLVLGYWTIALVFATRMLARHPDFREEL